MRKARAGKKGHPLSLPATGQQRELHKDGLQGNTGKEITRRGEAKLITTDCCTHHFGHKESLATAAGPFLNACLHQILQMPSQQHVLGKGRTQGLHQTPRTKVLPTPTQDPLAARKISQAFLWKAEAWI